MALEAKLAHAIKDFLGSAKITASGVEVPYGQTRTALYEALTNALQAAIHEGRHIASGIESRGLISATKDLAGRAVAVISGIVEQLVDKAQSLLDALLGDGGDLDEESLDEIEDQIGEWSEEYAEMVATTEITSAIEESVFDVMAERGVAAINWDAEPDACPRCLANAEASPIALGSDFPSSDTVPPAHPNCRCTTSPA